MVPSKERRVRPGFWRQLLLWPPRPGMGLFEVLFIGLFVIGCSWHSPGSPMWLSGVACALLVATMLLGLFPTAERITVIAECVAYVAFLSIMIAFSWAHAGRSWNYLGFLMLWRWGCQVIEHWDQYLRGRDELGQAEG